MRREGAVRRHYARVALPLMLVALSVTVIQYQIPTIMERVMDEFSMDAGSASWLMSVFTLVGLVAALPVAGLAGRVGAKRLMVGAAFLASLATLASAFADGAPMLLALRALEGLGLVAIVASGPLVMQRCVDPRCIGSATGIWMLGGMLGATLAGISTPVLYEAVGFRGLCLAYAGLAALSGVVLQVAVKVPQDDAAGGLVDECVPSATTSRCPKLAEGRLRVFLARDTWCFLVSFALFQMLLLGVLSFAPTAMQQRGVGVVESGFASTLPMLLAIVSSLAFGRLSDRFGRNKPLYLAGMLAMAPCTWLLLTTTGPVMWVAAVVMGLFAMGAPTVVVAAYPRVLGKPGLLGVGMGVLLLVQSLGQFLGSFVPSLLLGPDLTQWALCGAVLCAAGLAGAALVAACRFD